MTVREYIKKQDWIFAKTYANKAPHEYLLKKNAIGTEKEFSDFCHAIHLHGFPATYWNCDRRYLYLDGWLYWLMEPPEKATIVNRCVAGDYDIKVSWKGKKS